MTKTFNYLKIGLLTFPWLALSTANAAFQASISYRYLDYDGFSNFNFEKPGEKKLLFSDDDHNVYLSFISESGEAKTFSIEDFEDNSKTPTNKITLEAIYNEKENRSINSFSFKKKKSNEKYSFDIYMRGIDAEKH